MNKRSRTHTTARDFPRTARLNHLVHEIVADEIERLDDDRLGFFTVVAVDVEADLRKATVWYSSLPVTSGGSAPDDADGGTDDTVVEALADHRARLQSAIGRQAHLKRTPELVFRADTVIREAERMEELFREIATDGEGPTPDGPPGTG